MLSTLSCRTTMKLQTAQDEGQNEISYFIKGKGETIVFIHAGGLDKNMWQNQLDHFGKTYQVIAYDVRGHGASISKNEELLEIEDMKEVLKKEGISRFSLLGCSLGAILALDYALAFPEEVEKLILVSPGLIGFQETDPEFLSQISRYAGAIQQGKTDLMLEELKKMNAIGKENRILSAEIDDYVTACLQQYIQTNSHLRAPKIKEIKPLTKLGQLPMETLILFGELDHDYIKANAQKLNEQIANTTMIEVENAGHLVNLEAPDVFNKQLASFLKK